MLLSIVHGKCVHKAVVFLSRVVDDDVLLPEVEFGDDLGPLHVVNLGPNVRFNLGKSDQRFMDNSLKQKCFNTHARFA